MAGRRRSWTSVAQWSRTLAAWPGRPLVLAMSVTLVASLLTVVASPRPAAADVVAKLACPVSRPDVASALVAARWCGGRVEVLGDLTETTQVWANPDSSLTSQVSAGPVRMRRGREWVAVDLTLRRNPDGSVSPVAHPKGLRLSGARGTGSRDLVTLGSGSTAVSVGWDGALPPPVLDGPRATYPDVRPGVDLVLEVTRTGYEESLVVKTPAALARMASLTMPLRSTELAASADGKGGLSLRDRRGGESARMLPPVMFDAAIAPQSLEHVHRASIGVSLAAGEPGATDVVLRPDPAFLADPGLTFPVTIDPITVYASFDTFVQTGYTSDQSGATDLKLGYSDDGGPWTARSFLRFPNTGLTGTHVNSATLYLWEYHSWSCTAAQWELWLTSTATTSTRWTAQPTWYSQQGVSSETKGWGSACNDGWVSIPATGAFQTMADQAWPDVTLGLKATSESNHNGWKRFNSSDAGSGVPYVVLNYNTEPAVLSQATLPSSSCATNATRPYINTLTPTLSAQLADPEGAPVTATFEWYVTGGAKLGQAVVGPQASGSTFTTLVPPGAFSNGGTYSWRVQGTDGSVTSDWSGYCELTEDTTEPNTAPGVSAAALPDNTWTGAPPTYTVTTASQSYVDGTTTLLLAGDDEEQQIALPFTVNFFNQPYNNIWVDTDGMLFFTDPGGPVLTPCCANLPNAAAPNAVLYPFTDDLLVDGSASVRTILVGSAPNRQYIVDWHNVAIFDTPSERLNFEVVLGEDGTISYNYSSLDNNDEKGAHALVGLEDQNGAQGVPYAQYQPILANNTAIVFHPAQLSVTGYTASTAARTYTPATTVLPLTGDDTVAQVATPFPINYYGDSYQQVWVDTNGQVDFVNPSAPNPDSIVSIPDTAGPNGGVNVFADDLVIDSSASVRTAVVGTAPNRQFIVEWNNATFYHFPTLRVSAEVIFNESGGDIVTNYSGIDSDNNERGGHALVGVENASGLVGTQYEYLQPVLVNNTSVVFHPIPSAPLVSGGTPVSFTFTANGIADAASYQYGLDTNPPATVVNAASIGGNATLTITAPTDGTHKLYVRSQDRAGNQSPITTYTLNVGLGGLNTPHTGDISAGTTTLAVDTGAATSGLTYQWRRADTDAWATIPTSDVTRTVGGAPVTAWPLLRGGGAFPTLNWNLANTINGAEAGPDPLDGPLQVRVVFSGPVGGSSTPMKITFDRNLASGASSQVGPGSANLLTGNLTLSRTDVSVDSYGSNLTVTRAFNTRQASKSDAANMFGPGWVSGVAVIDADAPYTNLTVTGSLVQVGLPEGSTLGFTEASTNAAGKTYDSDTGFEDLRLSYAAASDTYTLKDLDGNTVSFTHVSGASSTVYNPTAVTTPGSGQTTSVSWQKVTVGGVEVVRPTQVLAPVPAGLSCGTLVKGCRALSFTYAATTTATGTSAGQWADYTGRVSQISFTAWDPDAGPAAMRTIVMAQYQYDSNGRLRAVWDPRLDYADGITTRHLADTFDYDADGVITTLTPAGGEQPWQLGYTTIPGDPGKGRLAQVTRSALTAGTARTTVVYAVPTTGAGAPYDLSAGQTSRWGQAAPPVAASAVFPATQVPDGNQATGVRPSSYERATITYTDANGRSVNTIVPGGHTATSWYDQYGHVIASLSAANRQRALTASATDTPAQEAAIANRESTLDLYSPDGQELRETFGPEHDVVVAGSLVRGREHTVNSYDQGAPSTGGPFHQITTAVASVSYTDTSGAVVDAGARTTTTGYDWTLRQRTITTDDPAGLALSIRLTYDPTTGLTTSVTDPAGGTTTNTPATTQTVYYRAGTGSGYAECDSHAEWANLVCRSQPGGQAATGPEIPVTVTTYDMYQQPRVKTEKTSAGTLRTTTTSYDTAGRESTVVVAGPGAVVPTQRTLYDQATGFATHLQSLGAGNTVTADIVSTYDTLGQLTSYVDADANASTTTYDIAGRLATTNDGKATRTYTYDGGTERRGLATQVVDAQAGTFTGGAYDPDGRLTAETWPDGIVVSHGYDETGTQTAVNYTRPGCGQPDCTLYTERVHQNAHGQQADRSSSLSSQKYGYDATGRLSTVNDTVAGSCTTRTYAFNTASDRTNLVSYNAAGDGTCQNTTGSTTSWTYDTADRVNTAGYTYDALGRVTTTPAADTQNPGGGNLAATYHANDLVASVAQGGVTNTYTLDVGNQRIRGWSVNDGSTATIRTNHFDGSSDSPAWIAEGGGDWTRPTAGLGTMAVVIGSTGTDWQISNLHGDCVATVHNAELAPAATSETTEYGALRNPTQLGALRYGWLGAKQRPADTPSGIVLMGVRLYNPTTGRFLQRDPVPGGSANSYDYANQDPVNGFDLDGRKAHHPRAPKLNDAERKAIAKHDRGEPLSKEEKKAYKSGREKQKKAEKYAGKRNKQKRQSHYGASRKATSVVMGILIFLILVALLALLLPVFLFGLAFA